MAFAFIVARQEASYDELQSQQIPAFDEMHSMTQPHCDDVAYDGKGPVEAHADPPETGVWPPPGLASTAPDSASRDLRPHPQRLTAHPEIFAPVVLLGFIVNFVMQVIADVSKLK